VDLVASLDAPCAPDLLYRWVEDLGTYPQWLTIVTRAERLSGEEPAWIVDLRGRLGPLARSKRLRMVRTHAEPDAVAVFERQEDDGRHHSPWVLRAEVTSTADGSHLRMHLHYGGTFWGPVLERLLRDEVEQGSRRLLDLVR